MSAYHKFYKECARSFLYSNQTTVCAVSTEDLRNSFEVCLAPKDHSCSLPPEEFVQQTREHPSKKKPRTTPPTRSTQRTTNTSAFPSFARASSRTKTHNPNLEQRSIHRQRRNHQPRETPSQNRRYNRNSTEIEIYSVETSGIFVRRRPKGFYSREPTSIYI